MKGDVRTEPFKNKGSIYPQSTEMSQREVFAELLIVLKAIEKNNSFSFRFSFLQKMIFLSREITRLFSYLRIFRSKKVFYVDKVVNDR